MKTTVGIIGGTGEMGRWFSKFFRKKGCRVLVASRHTKLRPRALVERSDVVIFSVPIGITVDVIKKYAKYAKPGSVLADFTSIKVAPVKAMLKNAPKGVEVVGMHPVFGPGEKSLRNQTIVLTPGNGKKWLKWFREIFSKAGAKITVSTPEKHDRMMAVVQALTHFSALPVGYALKTMGADLKTTMKFTSPIYRVRLGLIARILSQDSQLYADLLTMNPYSVKAIAAYLESAGKLGKAVKKRDSKQFARYLDSAAAYFKKSGVRAL